MQPLFTVEVVLEHSRTKDHLQCEKGEVLFVLLIAHDKMPSDKYLVEKEDGNSESNTLLPPSATSSLSRVEWG